MPRLGEINPDQEPYRGVLLQEQITVFNLTKLEGNAHNRAFDDITQVVVMVREQLSDEPVVTEGRRIVRPRMQ
jgi:hypothetical protein